MSCYLNNWSILHRFALMIAIMVALSAWNIQDARSESGSDGAAAGPELSWTTYLGGVSIDYGQDMALDKQGFIYLTGFTSSNGWANGVLDTGLFGENDGFVVKLTPTGAPLWSMYLGGADKDEGEAITVDSQGSIYIVGKTWSEDWISGGYDTVFHRYPQSSSAESDGFIVKLSSTGEHLWSTYLGGTGVEEANDVVADSSGNIYVAGYTCSSGWLKNGFDTSYNYTGDGFVAKFSSSGQLVWGSYLGGDYQDFGQGVALDSQGNVLVTGMIQKASWISGGYLTSAGWGFNGFAVKLTPDGRHIWSTFLNKTLGSTCGYAIAVDSSDNALVTGYTSAPGWTSGGYDTTLLSGQDAFVVKISPQGKHVWSTYVGGDGGNDEGRRLDVDGAGNVCVTGSSRAAGWVSGGFDDTHHGQADVFVVRISQEGQHLWSAYLGGGSDDACYGQALDRSGNIFLTGNIGLSVFAAKITVDGSLRVIIEPKEAAAAGAQWRRVGSSLWRDSGVMESDIPAGTYVVEFKTSPAWAPPRNKTVSIVKGQTCVTSITYGRYNAISEKNWMSY